MAPLIKDYIISNLFNQVLKSYYTSSDMSKGQIRKLGNQMPINQESLMHLSFFISYCKDNGLIINEEGLEELHKLGLVFPALKVYLGIVEHRKIFANIHGQDGWYYVSPKDLSKFKVIKLDKKKYYSVGGLSKFRSTWLDYYFENGMTEMPSLKKFQPWDKKHYYDYYTNANVISKKYQFLYDKKQILAIKIAYPYLNLLRKWAANDKQKMTEYIQKRIAELYKFFEVYHEIEKFYNQFKEKREERVAELKKSKADGEKIKKIEWEEEFDFEISPQFKKLSQKIVKDFGIDKDMLCDWRNFLSRQSLINESGRSSKIKREYIKSLSIENIIGLEDTNYMIYIMNIFLFFLTGKEDSVKQVLGDFNYQICSVCNSGFKPRNKDQITCGSNYCVKEHKNQLKRDKRKMINIKKRNSNGT
jgi:hypothetical protein